MELSIKKEIVEKTVILFFKGILDITTTNIVVSELDEIENIGVLILDFSELDFIDSTGIGSILNAIYLSQEKKFKLKLKGINEVTNDLFETVGLFQILEALNGEVI